MRTLCRITVEGKPNLRDKRLASESALIEDRVVLFRAISFDDAIAQAIKGGARLLQADTVRQRVRPKSFGSVPGRLRRF